MSASKLEAAKAIRNRLRAPTADERIELVTRMVTAIERDHPDRFTEVLDIVIGVYEASEKFVKEVQNESLTRSVPTHLPKETNRVVEPSRNGVSHSSPGALEKATRDRVSVLRSRLKSAVEAAARGDHLRANSDIGKTAQVTNTSKAAKRSGDDSVAKEPKKAKIANKASKAKTVAFQDGGEDDGEYIYI
ncbi:hypothetical protein SLS58_002912 [Diplodia intermedia]|uniref:Uncharacterized protein n=1 Tax=Diplodia intermedia TaxID=856260 RepID=A0ABR3TYA8_9PEZI